MLYLNIIGAVCLLIILICLVNFAFSYADTFKKKDEETRLLKTQEFIRARMEEWLAAKEGDIPDDFPYDAYDKILEDLRASREQDAS